MNRLIKTLSLLSLLSLFFTDCKRDIDFSLPVTDSSTVAVTAPTCRINAEGSDQTIQNGNQYSLSYDNAGNLASVLSTNSGSSQIITNTTISARQIDIELDGIGNIQTYDFDDNIFAGQPDSYSLTRQSNGSSNRNLTLSFDKLGRVTNVSAYKASTSQFIQALDVTYDNAGNAVTLTYSSGTGASVAKATYQATTYDQKHNPYDSLKGSQLMMYDWDFFSGGNTLAVFQHLSRHNPEGWGITDGSNSNNVSLVYQYNEQGYPVSIRQTSVGTYSGVTSTAHAVLNYSYDCK